MPRDGTGQYHQPFPDVTEGTTIESTVYNGYTNDVTTDLNTPRPISVGGTGADNATQALINMGGEKSGQVITNYNSDPFISGSFYSATSATGSPVAGHAFTGIAYISDANNLFIEARDQDDGAASLWVRQKKTSVWSAWVKGASIVAAPTPPSPVGDNTLFWDSTQGKLFYRYNDGDSVQWVEAVAVPDIDPGLYVEIAGDTMTGPLILSGGPGTALGAATKSYVDTAVAALLPATTVMPFFQAAAPVGWTKLVTQNDKVLRVVSGTGGVAGGANPFSTVMALTATSNFTLTTTEMPAHTHTQKGLYGAEDSSTQDVKITLAGNAARPGNGSATVSQGSGGAHSHGITMNIQYVDLILASKN